MHAHIEEHHVVPESLDVVRTSASAADPWGMPYRIEPRPDQQFALFCAGADAKFGTADDMKLEPDFIYFQF